MNIDTLAGEANDLKGRVKQSLGEATGDKALESEGVSDQVSGRVRKAIGDIRDFARAQPALAVAAVAAIGAALLFSRRGSTAR